MIERERLTSERLPEEHGNGLGAPRGIAYGLLAMGLLFALAVVILVICKSAAHAGEPVYRPDWATCPGGWHASGQFCVENGRGSANALLRGSGACPGGWRASGGYCVANGKTSPRAVRNKGGTCPAGWRASGQGFCVK